MLDKSRLGKELSNLLEEQEKFRRKNLRNPDAILEYENNLVAKKIELLEKHTGSNILDLAMYYREWYSKDSTAEHVVATVICKKHLYWEKHLKILFGIPVLEKVKLIIGNNMPNLQKHIDELIATPLTSIFESWKDDILEDYNGKDTPEAQTVFAIFCFQADDERFLATLDTIESRLQSLTKERSSVDEVSSQDKTSDNEAPNHPIKKLLFPCLYQLLKECGYKGHSKIYTEVTLVDFYSFLKSGTPFKDVELRHDEHGEECHLIQLICLALEYQKPGGAFLNKHPTQFFNDLGPADIYKNTTLRLFWLNNFEVGSPLIRIHKYTGELIRLLPKNYIGRSVFSLHNYLTHPKSRTRYPLLHHLLSSRAGKTGLTEEKKKQRFKQTFFELETQPKTGKAPEAPSQLTL